MDEHRSVFFATVVVLLFVVSAMSVGLVLTDESDASGTWTGENPSGSSSADPYDAISIDISGTNVPVLSDVYVSVGASVSITGCTDSWSHGSSNYTYNFTSVTSGFGLSVSTSGDTSVSGIISKAGNITVNYHYVQSGGSYERDENRSFVIHAVDPDAGLVQSISIRSSISTGTISTGGTLTLTATTSPTTADDRHVEWTIQSGSQYGEISRTTNTSTGGTCVIEGTSPGTIVVRCDSVDGNASETYTVTVNPRMVTSISIYQGFSSGDDLIITADVWPTNAYNREVEWSVTSGSSLVTMRESHEYDDEYEMTFSATGSGSGAFTVRVSATDGSGEYEERTFYVNHVSFDANGGSGGPSDIYKVSGSSSGYGSLPDGEPSRSGFAFMGWCTDEGGNGSLYNAGAHASLRDGTTYYAIWGLETNVYYHVTQGTGGPTEDSIVIIEGGSDWFYVSEEIPYRSGYTFLGWSETSGATSAMYEPGERISVDAGTEEINLYDVWTITINNYTLHYNPNEGQGGPGDATGTNAGAQTTYEFTISSTEPTREGYRFVGWSTNQNAQPGDDGIMVAGDKFTVVHLDTTEIYAVWQEVHYYTLAYDANGGQGAPTGDTYETVNNTYSVPISSDIPTWDEFHIFLGWSDVGSESKTPNVMPGEPYTFKQTGTTTLYAVWQEIEGNVFEIIYDLNGGIDGPDVDTFVTVASSYPGTVSSVQPEWDQYHLFLGWAVEDGSSTVAYQPGSPITLLKPVTDLYAVWQRLPMPFTLSFELGGGTWISQDQTGTTVEDTYEFTIPSTIPEREGFGFLGWSTSDGGAVAYHPGDSFVATVKHSTLYAVWQEFSLFTLSFDTGNGSGMSPLTGYSLDSYEFMIPDTVPELENYFFLGWAVSEGGSAEIQPGQRYTATSISTTLYAVWLPYSASVDFHLYFDDGDGAGAPSEMTRPSQDGQATFIIPSSDGMVRDGYVFTGWATYDGGPVEYVGGDEFVSHAINTTLYAVWVEEDRFVEYTLTFDTKGGSEIDAVSGSSADGFYEFEIPSEPPVRDGFVFMGWATADDPSEAVYQPGDVISVIDADTVLYAVWQSEDTVFTLSFDVGEGASGAPQTIIEIGEGTTHSFRIPSETPMMEGFEFLGWSTSYGGDVEYQPGEIFVSGVRDATLFAVWHLIDNTVIQLTSEPTDRTDVGTQYTYEVTTNIDVFSVTIRGSAADWLSVNGHTIRGTPFEPGTYELTITVTDGDDYRPTTATFTIRVMETDVWEHHVEFVTSGGTDVEDQWVVTGGTVSEPETPVKDGFTFGGWYSDDGSKYDFTNPVNSDMTLKAVWISTGGQTHDEPSHEGKDWTSYIWIVLAVLAVILFIVAVASSTFVVLIPAIIVAILAVASYFVLGGQI